MSNTKRPQSATEKSFFYDSSFRNIFHANNMKLWEHYADLLFEGDMDRIVYVSSEFAFRKRSRLQEGNRLNLPFMNFRIRPGGVTNGVERRWWNHSTQTYGIWVPEVQRKLRIQPVTITYDSNLYVYEEDDLAWTMNQLLWDDGNETVLKPQITIKEGDEEHTISNIAILGYDLEWDAEYNESDWLKQEKMRVIRVNMSVQTFLLKDNFSFGIPKEFVLNFAARLWGDEEEMLSDPDATYRAVIDRVEESTSDLEKD